MRSMTAKSSQSMGTRPDLVSGLLLLVGVLSNAGCVATTSGQLWTKEGVARWYDDGRGPVRFIGYQGSDATQHHFIARVMDAWTFFQLSKEDLRLPDEHPFPSVTSAQLYYYLVDPARDFAKVNPKQAINQPPEPMSPSGRGSTQTSGGR